MKKILSIVLILALTAILCACGAPVSEPGEKDTEEINEVYIITTSEMGGCTLVTTFLFDDDMKLTGVSQKADYTDTSRMTLEYSLVESDPDSFTDLVKDDNSFSCKLTKQGIESFYPDATYDSILKTAEDNGLTVETSK